MDSKRALLCGNGMNLLDLAAMEQPNPDSKKRHGRQGSRRPQDHTRKGALWRAFAAALVLGVHRIYGRPFTRDL